MSSSSTLHISLYLSLRNASVLLVVIGYARVNVGTSLRSRSGFCLNAASNSREQCSSNRMLRPAFYFTPPSLSLDLSVDWGPLDPVHRAAESSMGRNRSRGRLLLDYDANSVTASSQTPAPAVVARPYSVWLVPTNEFADLSSAWRDSHLNRKEGTPTPRSRRREIPFGKVRIGRLTIILLSLLLLLRGIS